MDKPHSDNQIKFFHSKGFQPKGGIRYPESKTVDAMTANKTVDAMTAGAKVRPTQ